MLTRSHSDAQRTILAAGSCSYHSDGFLIILLRQEGLGFRVLESRVWLGFRVSGTGRTMGFGSGTI